MIFIWGSKNKFSLLSQITPTNFFLFIICYYNYHDMFKEKKLYCGLRDHCNNQGCVHHSEKNIYKISSML